MAPTWNFIFYASGQHLVPRFFHLPSNHLCSKLKIRVMVKKAFQWQTAGVPQVKPLNSKRKYAKISSVIIGYGNQGFPLTVQSRNRLFSQNLPELFGVLPAWNVGFRLPSAAVSECYVCDRLCSLNSSASFSFLIMEAYFEYETELIDFVD